MTRLLNLIFAWFQKRCPHTGGDVRADILEGELGTRTVQWCLRCGAYRFVYIVGHAHGLPREWRNPRADWTGEPRP